MSRRKDLTNQSFGKLTALMYAWSDKKGHAVWFCVCECGQIAFIRANSLLTKNTTSCGCAFSGMITKRNQRNATHGQSHFNETVEYRAYMAAKGRCTNPRNRCYADYGGRGIEFRFSSFEEFFACVGKRPSPAYSLDRIKNEEHYEAGNLRWATKRVQANNRRKYHARLLDEIASLKARLAELETA